MKTGMFLLIFSLLVCSSCMACSSDTVIIVKDARLDMLVAKQNQINKRTAMMTSAGLYKGYRLQLISTAKRDNANQVKTDFMNRFPEQKTYTLFQSPNFKVRIGNFLKKEDAEKYRNQISKFFPKGIYIVEDTIEYTPPEEEQE
ncbi:SPOR domain-containing protein [Sediminibacterium sp.]|uniref:SPOR domain-containing protein n=1 Tax=Sediminibacterium sp. TaxID=1917865 RepID=UPI002734A8C1|nr:SPOR domain-containing protein [Sediminibacterium sp.]MDP3392935.1 SPOR domain-containing protein [Sediminibacterium sp.]MDP3567141.1 SPOR domain-containing protein [Sediminibacterium sp.]